MSAKYLKLVSTICSLVLFVLIQTVKTDKDISPNKPLVPAPWGLEGNGYPDDASFHIKSEIHLAKSGKSFIFEEWATKITKSYRLDFVDRSTGRRGTILNNLVDKEKIYYHPYKCKSIDNLSDVMIPELANNFPSSDPWLIAGVGSIWYYASTLQPSDYKPASMDDSMIIGKITSNKFMKTLNSYTFKPTKAFPYELVFLFRQDDGEMNNSVVGNPEDLVAIQVHGQDDSNGGEGSENRGTKILLHLRILEMKAPLSALQIENYEIFEFPLGYGCEKHVKSSYTSPIDLQLTPQVPQIMELDIVVNQPANSESFSSTWKSYSTSIRITHGQLMFDDKIHHRYLSYETAFRTPDSSDGLKSARSSLHRLRKIWDLTDEQEASDGVYYEIDVRSNICKGFGFDNIDLSSNFIIPIDSKLFSPEGSNATLSAGLSLGPMQLIGLFSDTEEFHLLRRNTPTWSQEILIFEKKLDAFALLDVQNGQPIVTAPASLIRKHSLLDTGNEMTDSQTGANVEVSVYFFSQNREELLLQIKMILIEREFISEAYFHRTLNISPCSETLQNSPSSSAEISNSFKVNYPIDGLDDDKQCTGENSICQDGILDFDDSLESQAYEKFLSGLYEVSGKQLDPLQLVNMKVELIKDKSDNMLTVSGQLLDFPHLLSFRKTRGYTFSLQQTGKSSTIVKEMVADDRTCAESCKHYDCLMFSYCGGISKLCQLELKILTMDDQPSLTMDQDCNMYTMDERMVSGRQQRASGGELLHKMKQKLDSNGPPDQQPLDISIRLPDKSVVTFLASSIETNVDSMSQFDELAKDLLGELLASEHNQTESGTNDQFDDPTLNVDRLENAKNPMRFEYELSKVNSKFKAQFEINEKFPVQLAYHINDLTDCKSLCNQIDCRSFSYCPLDHTCQVSSIHDDDEIEAQSESADLCTIHRREYLSKFYLANSVSKPNKKNLPVQPFEVTTNKDCAARCMDSKSIDCKAFALCPTQEESSYTCYLSSIRELEPQDTDKTSTNSTMLCQFYKRRYQQFKYNSH